ncbi:MAG: hypothetical protein HZY75_03745 [Nocardioidaceae bacterium]|nr:MAG: hypothetical protein HZY75_03745 [Nocardioidaceae bacterium]
MTLYRLSFTLLMISVVCMTISAVYGSILNLLLSTICVFCSGYFLAEGRKQEVGTKRSR